VRVGSISPGALVARSLEQDWPRYLGATAAGRHHPAWLTVEDIRGELGTGAVLKVKGVEFGGGGSLHWTSTTHGALRGCPEFEIGGYVSSTAWHISGSPVFWEPASACRHDAATLHQRYDFSSEETSPWTIPSCRDAPR
jgi:hypothetical protein